MKLLGTGMAIALCLVLSVNALAANLSANDALIASAGVTPPVGDEPNVILRRNLAYVPNTTVAPYKSIVAIEINGQHRGTGFLVANNRIVTAAHVVYAFTNLQSVTSMKLEFGKSNTNVRVLELNKSHVTKIARHPNYNPVQGAAVPLFENDIAVIVLNATAATAISNAKISPLAMSVISDNECEYLEVQVAGYGTYYNYQEGMDFTANRMSYSTGYTSGMLTANRVRYGGLDTSEGHSGAPVMRASNLNSVVAVHNGGSIITPINPNNPLYPYGYNEGARITSAFISWINAQ